MATLPDPVELTRDLIRCPSVTPAEGGALALLEGLLTAHGFVCRRIDVEGIANLYARWGTAAPNFCFAGHTDVVPIGERAAWTADPFGAEIRDGEVMGRGATDMKSGVAAFAAAACKFVAETPPSGSISLLITGDEEGDAVHGTAAVLDWMEREGEKVDLCLVGEPTSRETLGDMIKIGRRGSLTAYLTATGVQGHSAYPHRARNPLPPLVKLLDRLASHTLDGGNEHFDASTLALTTIDVGNPANNVIPSEARATLNIRFNDSHTGASLIDWLTQEADAASVDGVAIGLTTKLSGESFLTPPGQLSGIVAEAVAKVTGVTPELSTTGGTSDARFIKNHCPVVEFGLVGKTMHQVDERAPVAEIAALSRVYEEVLRRVFAS